MFAIVERGICRLPARLRHGDRSPRRPQEYAHRQTLVAWSTPAPAGVQFFIGPVAAEAIRSAAGPPPNLRDGVAGNLEARPAPRALEASRRIARTRSPSAAITSCTSHPNGCTLALPKRADLPYQSPNQR